MLGKKSKPVIGKLTGTPVSGTGARLVNVATSPRCPLEFKTQSSRGLKIYGLGGVGLGIVADLEKTGHFRGQIQANKALYNMNLNRSKPIPVNSGHKYARFPGCVEKMDLDLMEEYTFVTCRGPDCKNYTRIYCDGGENGRKVNDKAMIDRRRSIKSNRASVFDISPAKSGDFSAYPASDFLSSCHLCRKNLHGRDIYMYRGEKAFCSSECRYRQIVMDEHKEKCSSEASRSVDVSTSPYTSDQMIPTGILAI